MQITSTKTFQGPFTDNYLKSDVFGVESTIWSECGADSMLNINSQIQLNPLDSQQSALLTVSHTLKSKYHPLSIVANLFALCILVRFDRSQVQANSLSPVEEVHQVSWRGERNHRQFNKADRVDSRRMLVQGMPDQRGVEMEGIVMRAHCCRGAMDTPSLGSGSGKMDCYVLHGLDCHSR